MILTTCAACAAPLAHDAPRCMRCETRYCSATCKQDHWRRGHKGICKKIHRGGNAEQHHADKKYKEAVAVAVAKCAEDTKGQTCYICTQAFHWETNEGLVRGCACRGTAGFVHVSCLAEQAKILYVKAEENNLGAKVLNERWLRWDTCSLCEQRYHGVVKCALGWACWKTHVGCPEHKEARRIALSILGRGLNRAGHHEDALSVQETELSLMRRVGASAQVKLDIQSNLACTYEALGRLEEYGRLRRDVYSGTLKLKGEQDADTLREGHNYAVSLSDLQHFEEAKALWRRTMPVARRVLGNCDKLTLKMRWLYAEALYKDPEATLEDLREAVTTLEDLSPIARRLLGTSHPTAEAIRASLQLSRAAFVARVTPSASA